MGDKGDAGKKGPDPRALRASVIALVLAVGFLAWVVTRDGDDGESAPASAQAETRIVSEEELANIASTVGHPVYWAGAIPGTELEVTESGDGSILVRYLEDGAGVEEGGAEFLAIGSYPLVDAKGAMDEFAEKPDAIVRRAPDGREVMTTKQAQTNVYFADLDNSLQIEVYDPSPQRAMSLARSGQVQPIG
jgi:hypothetical protein